MTLTIRRGAYLGVLLLLSTFVAACGGDDTTSGTTAAGAASATTAAPSKGTLKVGSTLDLAPMEFVDEKGKETGFEIEVVEAVAAKLGYKIEYVKTPFDQAFTGLQAQKYRLNASGIFVRCARVKNTAEVGEFTVPFFAEGQVFAAKKTRTAKIKTFADLKGLTLGVESAGSTSDSVADKNNTGGAFKKEIFPDQAALILALQQGRIDAALQSGAVMRYSVANTNDLEVTGTVTETVRPVAMLFRAGDALRQEFNTAINALKTDGTMTKIYQKWFKEAPDPDGPTAKVVPEVSLSTCSD